MKTNETTKRMTFVSTLPFILNAPLVIESTQLFLVLEVVQAVLIKLALLFTTCFPMAFSSMWITFPEVRSAKDISHCT